MNLEFTPSPELVFSNEDLYHLEPGKRLIYTDERSGRTVSVSFNNQNGTFLTVTGTGFEQGLTIGVDGDNINQVARIFLNAAK